MAERPTSPTSTLAGIFEGMDHATAQLILELQLSDIAEHEEATRRTEDASQPPEDQDTDASPLRREIQQLQTNASDQQLARSMNRAAIADGALVSTFREEEERDRRDHEIAQALEEGREAPATPPQSAELDDDTLARMAGLHISPTTGRELLRSQANDEDSGGDAVAAAEHQEHHTCTICTTDLPYFNVLPVPCGHFYCGPCLKALFQASYRDEGLFPPRCCHQRIPMDLAGIELFLPRTLRDPYEPRRVEVATEDRTYCSNTNCGVFIPPALIANDLALCPEPSCHSVTCARCKRQAHQNACAPDEAQQQVNDLAQQEGWQRCTNCNRMIELGHGCNHITCVCGHQFCYICGARWKTCRCPQWDENRLLARANVIADRNNVAPPDADRAPQLQFARDLADQLWDFGVEADAALAADRHPQLERARDQLDQLQQIVGGAHAALDPAAARRAAERAQQRRAARRQAVEQARQRLLTRHNCEHEEWTLRSGRQQCEECGNTLARYLLECDQCELRACVRCQRNRL